MTKQVDWLGRVLADGRYRIVDKLGEGSMGLVYRAYDNRLETEIVMKVPLGSSLDDPDFVERFNREIRSLVRLTHPHVVKIIDVGTEDEVPYVVMQYLSGGSLKDRLCPRGNETYAMPQESLNDWLLEVAKALDFMHGQNYLHRDVKPANILFDEYGNAFLGDFGLSKVMATEEKPDTNASLTAAGFLVGTPNYVAPEVVMGSSYDGRIDQYSLAMTVYEALAGQAPLEGPTASATMVNQTNKVPPSLSESNSAISPGLSAAVLKGLAKNPQRRYENCVALAQGVLAEVRADRSTGSSPRRGAVSKGEPGRIACPACRKVLPIKPEYAGKQARCAQCQAVLQISADATELKLVHVTPSASSRGESRAAQRSSARQENAAASDSARSQQAETVTALEPRGRLPAPSRPRKTAPQKPGPAGKPPRKKGSSAEPVSRFGIARIVGYLSIAAVLTIAYLMLNAILGEVESKKPKYVPRFGESRNAGENGAPPPAEVAATPVVATPATTTVNIACSPENQSWLETAAKAFQTDPAGKHITIVLQPAALVPGANAILQGPGSLPLQAWAPESGVYAGILEQEWRLKHSSGPLLRSEELLRSPMVFVMWRKRLEVFLKKYPELGFTSIAQAVQTPGGWGRIADKPEWGNFDFAHADPLTSNSGVLALILMAQEHARSPEPLGIRQVTNEDFQKTLQAIERSLKRTGDSLAPSSSALMDDMLLRDANEYDCVFVEESVALRALNVASERAAELQLVYPRFNMWNTFPFYVLDVPWSSKEQQGAASQFLSFLGRQPMQSGAVNRGFRPADASLPLDQSGSPFSKLAESGLQTSINGTCELPPGEVVRELLGSARRLGR